MMLESGNLTPNNENYHGTPVNKIHSKRAQWYSPCKRSVKIPLSPESDLPSLKLTQFSQVPKISFGNVAVGSSKTEAFIVYNPHSLHQTLEVVKCPTDKGFVLELNGQNFDGNVLTISPKEEKLLSITWEPKEGGNVREIIRFRWDERFSEFQVIVFGNAVGPSKPTLPKKTVKRKLNAPLKEQNAKLVLQPSQVLNTCGTSAVNGFDCFTTNFLDTLKKSNLENQMGENIRRDTYIVTNASARSKQKSLALTSNRTKLKPSTPNFSKLSSKVKSSVKTNKVVISKKKLSPPSGGQQKRPTRKVKLKVAAKGVAQRKLQLVKTPSKNNLPRHPMPFAAKNIYYDERWIKKQEEGFTKWLNFILTPPDECDSLEQVDLLIGNFTLGGSKSQPLAPTKEALSFRAYTARRKMARLRRSSCLLFQSEPLGHIIQKVEAEVENGRIAIRPDKKLHADFGIKRQVVDMLLSYNPLWLRIGLETVYGEILPVQSNDDKTGLSRFLTDRLLCNPDIARAFAHPQVPGLYREGYVEQLGKFTLKKFLLLVLFLDRAKLTRLIDHDPCLFNKEAAFKSNRSILLTFSREYLKGEGDLTKHLSFLGYCVMHSQKAIDEVKYAVANIATDLRDGLRLTRVTELLTQDWQLSAILRVPAISRLQKIHNVDVFMRALKERGVLLDEIDIHARHIVDGHREKTLALLWQIIFHFQVKVLLREKRLKEEIAHLESTRRLRDLLTAADNWTINKGADFLGKRRDSSDLYFKSDLLHLLFRWCKVVCRIYGVKVENFTVSFSDGRALCYLLHHYHPSLLPSSLIKQQTSLTCNPGVHDTSDSEEEEEGEMELTSWTEKLSPSSGTNKLLEELKNNERENFRTVAEKVKDLGGVPLMTKASDMSHTIPDEKVVITYVAYLCARLLDLREETKAARCIQMAWRRYRLERQLHLKKTLARLVVSLQSRARATILRRKFQAMRESAVLIQSVFRGHLARKQLRVLHQAARCIQTRYLAFRRGREVRERYTELRHTVMRLQAIVLTNQRERRAKKERAVTTVQAAWRGYAERRRLNIRREACINIQTYIRGFLQRKRYLQLKDATSRIQKNWRALILGKEERQRFLHIKQCVVALQSCYRGKRDRHFVREIRAAATIQRYVRAWQTRARYQLLKRAALKVQAYTRRYQAQRKFAAMKNAARVLQVCFRALLLGRRQRTLYKTQKKACVKIQSWVRCRLQRKAFLRKKSAAIRLQAYMRKFLAQKRYQMLTACTLLVQKRFRDVVCAREARQNFQRMKQSVVKIQSYYRGYKHRERFLQVKRATIILQSHARRFLGRKKFLGVKHASVVIQTRYRALQQSRNHRVKYQHTLRCIVRLQAIARGSIVRRHLHTQSKAAITIQAFYRQYTASKRYRKLRESAVVVQRRYRSFLLMREQSLCFQRIRWSVNSIQAYYRGYRARRWYRILKATVVLQSAVRGWQVREDVKRQQLAATVVQSLYRGHVLRRRYLSLRRACLVLQCRYRSVQFARKARSNYLCQRHAAVRLQSFFRGHLTRKQVQRLRSVRKIQAVFRGYASRKSYNHTRKSVILIQAVVRGYLARSHYTKLKTATLMLQGRYRARVISMCQYVRYHVQRGACIVLQSALRGYLCRKRYQEIRKAAVVCQQRYRSILVGRNQRQVFLVMKTAVVCLQACVRGWFVRKLVTRHLAARKIQATYKMYKARKQFLALKRTVVRLQAQTRMIQQRRRFNKLKNAALVIQRRFKARVLRKRDQLVYHFIRGAVITIQMVVRGYLVRARMRRMNNSAVKIQACARGFLARKKYKAMKRAALTLQLRCRAWLLGRVVARKYRTLRSGAVIIQSSYRQFRMHRELKRHRAATKLQCTFRRYSCRSKFLAEKSSAVTIQTAFRRYLRRRSYLKLYSAAIAIQQQFRAQRKMKKDRQRYIAQRKACIAIQTGVRGWLCRRRYNSIRAAAITMQRRRRALITTRALRQDYLQLEKATVIVQSRWRMLSIRSRYEKTRNAVLKIQAVFRMRKAIKFYENLKKATLVVQRRYRATRLCKEQHKTLEETRRSAIIIQAYIRGFQARQRVASMVDVELRRKAAAMTIQRYFRGYCCMKKTLIAYHITRGAIITMQASWRMYAAQKFVHKLKSIIKVQAIYRATNQRRKFLKLRDVVCKLQAVVRSNQDRKRFVRMKKAVTVVQKRYRAQTAMRRTCREYQRLKHATVVIQYYFRRHQQRQDYLRKKRKVVLAQSVVRMRLERTRFLQKRQAAIVIQRRYRSYIFGDDIRQRYRLMLFATVTIQCWWRAILERLWFTRFRMTAIVLQRACRRKLDAKNKSAAKIQALIRGNLARNHLRIVKKSVLRIQTLWRGYRVRREGSSLKVKRARKRIESANAAATESMKLCNRTRSALDFLLQCKNISRIVGALTNLEVVTRLSEVCCQQVVEDGALPVIFKVIKKCNRSLPHLEVIKYSLSILYNVAKFPSVYRAIYEVLDSVDTLIELLVNFRDKSIVFCKTCYLLVLLCRDASIALDIRNKKRIVHEIRSVHNITERNYKLEAKRNKFKSKVENITCHFAPPTPCKLTPYRGKKSSAATWQSSVEVATDPLEAVRLLVRRLGLAALDK
ncbi:abnormal spindle-like microcephaly-associated protein homolog [Montipora capricornis]|uniref:abnormal spindle-like microcephaly-associated protein homolog n=1 Tax=Montipora capricornis TaxID=246305 RepID=UPI0035F187E8